MICACFFSVRDMIQIHARLRTVINQDNDSDLMIHF